MFFCATNLHDYYTPMSQRTKDWESQHTIRIVTAPTAEPVTIAEAKAQLHIGASDDSHDVEIASMIAAAREEWERDTSIALITRTIEQRMDRFYGVVLLMIRPLIEVLSVSYVDSAGDTQTIASSNYYTDIDKLAFKGTFNRPNTEKRSEAVRIQYTAGYGTDSRFCPELDRMAIKLSLANRFEDRDMISASGDRKAYEMLVAKKMRASYP